MRMVTDSLLVREVAELEVRQHQVGAAKVSDVSRLPSAGRLRAEDAFRSGRAEHEPSDRRSGNQHRSRSNERLPPPRSLHPSDQRMRRERQTRSVERHSPIIR